jgi:hypothetical protein
MKIKLGIVPLASGTVQGLTPYSDGTIHLEFKTDSGKKATLIMDTAEATRIYNDLYAILTVEGA